MQEYIRGLKELEKRLRQSYVEIKGCDREEFMEMMAIDGAFLMEYLLRFYRKDCWQMNDRIFGRQYLKRNVKYDLVLIENQLPFFFLKHLFGLIHEDDCSSTTVSLKILVQCYLSDASPWKWPANVEIVTDERHVKHILHFLIICLQQSGIPAERKECKTCLATPTISELYQAGMKFKPISSNCLTNFKFNKGILEIPMLKLTDQVEMVFRNMQAFEQCHKSVFYVNDYIFIMDILVNNEDDMKVLTQNGIIDNWLEDNRAGSTVFNNLGKGNCIKSGAFSYAHVIEDVNAYYKTRRHKWKAILKQKYFNNPWTIISFVAAGFLLQLTILQTVFTILQVV